MAEILRELVVALSLDSSNFARNMHTSNQRNTGRCCVQYLSCQQGR